MALTHYTGQDPLAALRSCLPKPRWHNFVLLVVALGIARCCIAWQLAVAVLLPIRVESCYQRVKRLLAAAVGVDFAALQQAWIGWAVGHFAQPGGRLDILLDWTLHTDRCRSLWAQLDIGCGRGLPLAFWLADNQFGGKGKQRVFEDQALRQLKGWLPQGWPVLLIADRGFGGRDRMAFVADELGWSFLFRITGDGRVGLARRVRGRRGWRRRVYWQRVDADPPSPGQRWFKEKVRYGRHHSIEVNLAAVCLAVPGKADALWYLATNLPASEDVVALYALRMQIEQSFRDYKAGLGLEREYTRRPGRRLQWLLFGVMVAAGRALWQGCPLPGQEPQAKVAPAGDATTTATQAGPTETTTAAKRYRVVSDFRRGWHEGLNELVQGDSVVRQAILDARDKARAMQQRPQVVNRRKPLPTKNRHRTRPAA